MTALFLVLYAVLALVVVDVYSGALLIVCAVALGYRAWARRDYRRVRGGRWVALRGPQDDPESRQARIEWVDYVLIFLVARSALILVYGWIWGH